MKINYDQLEKETVDALDKNGIWILSTSYNDIVTFRSMSIINIGLNVYFQTNKYYIKSDQLIRNKNVA